MDNLQFFWVDFRHIFLPAARLLMKGEIPYLNPNFYNPPWALFPILPLIFLPESLAVFVWLLFNLAITLYAIHLAARYYGIDEGRLRSILFVALALSPFSLANLYTGQLSALVLLGVIGSFVWHSAGIAPMLLILKPNLGVPTGMLWLIGKVRNRDWKPISRALIWFGLTGLILTMIVPTIWAGLLDNLLGAGYMTTVPKQITSMPQMLRAFGIPLWFWVPFAVAAVWAIIRWPNLETVASASLVLTPYAHPHDNILLLVVILYYFQRRSWVALSLSVVFLCTPLLRLFLPIGYSVDGIAAVGVFLTLVLEKIAASRARQRETMIRIKVTAEESSR